MYTSDSTQKLDLTWSAKQQIVRSETYILGNSENNLD